MGHSAGGDLTDASLEGDIPFLQGSLGLEDVEREDDVGTRFAGPLEGHELTDGSGLAPMDVTGVLAFTKGAEAEEVLAVTSAERRIEAGVLAGPARREVHGVDRRVDDQLTIRRDLPRLFEEPEREPCGDTKPHVDVAPPPHGCPAVRSDLSRFWG